MALFGRRRRDDDEPAGGPPRDPDPALPALSRADATTLDRLTRETFASRGVEVTSDGAGQLTAMDGRRYGLTNLAARVSSEPRSAWPGLVAEHVDVMLASHTVPRPESLDEVRDLVLPRLRHVDDLPERPSYAVEVLPGVVELAAVDYPTHVAEMLGDPLVERLGGWPAIREQGMTNLRRLEQVHHETLEGDPQRDDAAVHLLTTEDYFAPSRLLVLDEVIADLGLPRSPHGVLLVVPNRHLLAFHSLSGAGVVAAMQVLVRIGAGECDGRPGALSPHVYFRPADGSPTEQVTRHDDGQVAVAVTGALADAFTDLGLVGR